MQKNIAFQFRGNPINSIRDILNSTPTPPFSDLPLFGASCISITKNANDSIKSSETLKKMLIFESELIKYYNTQTKKEALPKRPYCFYNMIKIQDQLELLDLLEHIKYMDNIINARHIIREFLHLHYDIKACNYITPSPCYNIESDEKINLISIKEIDIDTQFVYTTQKVKPINVTYELSPSKSIRNHIRDYLKFEQTGSLFKGSLLLNDPNIKPQNKNQETNSNNNNPKSANENNQHFYLPVLDIPTFLLSFTYYDGRDFYEKYYIKAECHCQDKNIKLPTFKKRTSCSEFSYKLVLKQIKELYEQNINDKPLTMSILYRCNDLFLFCKLNCLSHYYSLYTSDTILNAIIHKYKISFSDIIILKEFITNIIFNNPSFIISGLRSKYLDFMLPFDIFFQYAIFCDSNKTGGLNALKHTIKLCICRTQILLESGINSRCIINNLLTTKNNCLDILSSENKIMKNIETDPFYTTYYQLDNNIFVNNFLNKKITDEIPPIKFDYIKTAFYNPPK